MSHGTQTNIVSPLAILDQYSSTDKKILERLAEANQTGEKVYQGDLADSLGKAQSTISESVSFLEREGLVEREKDDFSRSIVKLANPEIIR